MFWSCDKPECLIRNGEETLRGRQEIESSLATTKRHLEKSEERARQYEDKYREARKRERDDEQDQRTVRYRPEPVYIQPPHPPVDLAALFSIISAMKPK